MDVSLIERNANIIYDEIVNNLAPKIAKPTTPSGQPYLITGALLYTVSGPPPNPQAGIINPRFGHISNGPATILKAKLDRIKLDKIHKPKVGFGKPTFPLPKFNDPKLPNINARDIKRPSIPSISTPGIPSVPDAPEFKSPKFPNISTKNNPALKPMFKKIKVLKKKVERGSLDPKILIETLINLFIILITVRLISRRLIIPFKLADSILMMYAKNIAKKCDQPSENYGYGDLNVIMAHSVLKNINF